LKKTSSPKPPKSEFTGWGTNDAADGGDWGFGSGDGGKAALDLQEDKVVEEAQAEVEEPVEMKKATPPPPPGKKGKKGKKK